MRANPRPRENPPPVADAPAATLPGVDTVALDEFLTTVQSYTSEMIFVGREQPLFHYTDLGGLHGIVLNHDLWLTHSRYSNDDEEMIHGYRLAQAVIEEQRRESPSVDRGDYLSALADRLKEPTEEGVYICCFCREDDLLSQWRSYGANGTGVSIQLDPAEFAWLTGPDSPVGGLMRLWKVFYNPDRQQAIIREAIDHGFRWPSPLLADRVRRAAEAVQFFIPTFKNQDFEEEQECRLIFTPPPLCPVRPRFRTGRGMLIPYYSLQQLAAQAGPHGGPRPLPILGVRVGPSPQKSLNVDSARLLLHDCGYRVPVEFSGTPYRG